MPVYSPTTYAPAARRPPVPGRRRVERPHRVRRALGMVAVGILYAACAVMGLVLLVAIAGS